MCCVVCVCVCVSSSLSLSLSLVYFDALTFFSFLSTTDTQTHLFAPAPSEPPQYRMPEEVGWRLYFVDDGKPTLRAYLSLLFLKKHFVKMLIPLLLAEFSPDFPYLGRILALKQYFRLNATSLFPKVR